MTRVVDIERPAPAAGRRVRRMRSLRQDPTRSPQARQRTLALREARRYRPAPTNP